MLRPFLFFTRMRGRISAMPRKPCPHNPVKGCEECRQERIRESSRRAYEKHKADRQERARRYYQDHREERLAFRAEYRAADPEKIAEQKRRYYEENKPKIAATKRRLRGMIFAPGQTFESMFLEQGGLCPGCTKPLPEGKHCHVDHCHTTGKVRGLLCHKCNTGLGLLDENTATLKRLTAYLERHAPADSISATVLE